MKKLIFFFCIKEIFHMKSLWKRVSKDFFNFNLFCLYNLKRRPLFYKDSFIYLCSK